MFDRYTIATTKEKLHTLLGVEVPESYKPQYNAAPTRLLPVITNESPKGISFFYWGLPPSISKNKTVSKRLVNAEMDLLETKRSYTNSLQKQRCLVAADGLYFWKKLPKKGRVPYRFILNDQEPFFLVGIWDEFEDNDETQVHTFNIITMPSSAQLSPYSDTMPLILPKELSNKWLSEDVKLPEALALLQESPEVQFGFYPVSSKINNIELNLPEMILQSSPADQFGNYSLFD